MSKFLVKISGVGGEYAAVKIAKEDSAKLISDFEEDCNAIVDKADEFSGNCHCTGVFVDEVIIKVTDLESGKQIETGDWDQYECRSENGFLELEENNFCVCSLFRENGTFGEFEIEDDEFDISKLYSKQFETRFGDIAVGFGYGSLDDEDYIFIGEGNGYLTQGIDVKLAIFNSDGDEIPADDFNG